MRIVEHIFNLYGLREIKGEDQNNPEILKFFRELDKEWVKTDETGWCAAVVNYLLKINGFPFRKTLSAKSLLALGDQISVPKPIGSSEEFVDIVLFYRGKSWKNDNPDSYEPGHVGFPLNERENIIYTLGGNQGDMFKVSAYSRSRLEQFRRIYK